MRTPTSILTILFGVLVALLNPKPSSAQQSATLLRQQAAVQRQAAADYKRKSDDYSRQADATESFSDKSRLLRASMDFFNKYQAAVRMAEQLEAQADAIDNGTAPFQRWLHRSNFAL
jgi:hypothetical protein